MSEGWTGANPRPPAPGAGYPPGAGYQPAAASPAAPGPAQTQPRPPVPPPAQQPPAGPGGARPPHRGPGAGPASSSVGRSSARRRARLVIKRVDPWSVLKFSLVFSLCLVIVFVVAVMALYLALDTLGVFDSLNETLLELTQSGSGDDATGGVTVVFSAGRVAAASVVIGLINVVIITAISTLAAFLYNLCADIVGGLEVTLAERE